MPLRGQAAEAVQPGRHCVTRTYLAAPRRRVSRAPVASFRGVSRAWAAAVAALVLGCATPQTVAPEPPPPPPVAVPAAPPVDPVRELALGREARQAGDRAAAKLHLAAAAQADPSGAEARLDLAELLIDDGSDLDTAGDFLRQAQYLQTEPARFARLCGALAELRGDEAGAAEAYRTAVELSPEPELRLRRALLLARLGRAGEAEAELSRVVAERPGERAARTALSEVYERSGERDAAEHQLAVMAALAPTDAAPLHALAAFYRRRGEAAKATATEQRARSLEGEGRKLRPLLPARR
jgi:tetratricopeptide (TPR) repeat protein